MRFLWLIILIGNATTVVAQRVTITGVIKNGSGEELPSANIVICPDSTNAVSDNHGIFEAGTIAGEKTVIISYTGYETLTSSIFVGSDTTVIFTIATRVTELGQVTVNAERYSSEDIVQSSRTGTTTLTQTDINAIPVLGGEADVIKTLQLLPGTVRGVEGSSDLFVRGGAADQNLVLLDGATVYNTGHLFGFVSVFNPSILDNVEAINGGFPASYGGRLSSILDITSNAHVPDRTRMAGEIGLIATRFYLEQPLVKNKASFWVAARRTYIDQVVKAAGDELPYFFYDLNGKLIVEPSDRNTFEFSVYNGEDVLDIFRDRNNDGNGFLTSYESGNSTQSVRWMHGFTSGWRSSVSLMRSAYDYRISNIFEENQLLAFSEIEDYGAKVILTRDSAFTSGHFQFGADWTKHSISPNVISTTGSISELLGSSASEGKVAHEIALYVQREFPVCRRLTVDAGMRASAGLSGQKRYVVPEPRLSMRYMLSSGQSVKLSYSRMAQYMHRISNSAVTTPMDVWYTITDEIAPQRSHQVAAAWQRFTESNLYLSAEAYYKDMDDLIGYEEGTNLFFNTDFESRLIQGSGKAYGLEMLARKESGKLTGWISYTLSWSRRHFPGVNGDRWFPSRYDRRHNGAVVAQYAISTRWAASVVWEFISGARFTPVIGQYVVLAPTLTGVDLIPVYSGINKVKLADTHRLDAGIKFMSKPGRKFQWHWFAGVYNAYNRASPIGIIIERNELDGSLKYLQPGLFGLLPFISYGFRL